MTPTASGFVTVSPRSSGWWRRRSGRAARGALRGVDPVPRGRGRPSPCDPRDRGSPLGRRRDARVPGPPGLGRRRRPAVRPRHGPPGALHRASRVGRRQGERHHDLALAAGRGRDARAARRAPHPIGAPRRHAGPADEPRGWQSAVRARVRPHARRPRRRSRRRRLHRAPGFDPGPDRGPPRFARALRPSDPSCKTRRWWATVSGRAPCRP